MDRRELLRLGAAGAGGLLISSAASSVGIPLTNMILPQITRDPLAPTLPSIAPTGVNPMLFQRAKAALATHGASIRNRDTISVVDFSLPSSEPRFHVIHLASNQVESFRVAHGSGSDPDHSGFVEMFSNEFGSHATSNGTYITADTYEGKYGLSMKVDGLDATNNNAEPRAIVIHNAWYAEDDMIPVHGKLGRSEGCFAFSRASQWKVMSRLGGGRMIYAEKLA